MREEMPIALKCPHCEANVLDKGFYNYCTETNSVKERNSTTIHEWRGEKRVSMDHDEDYQESQSHECDLEAFCTACCELLPWPLYKIRALDGATLPRAQEIIERLLQSQ